MKYVLLNPLFLLATIYWLLITLTAPSTHTPLPA